jgi:hypothetical protein
MVEVADIGDLWGKLGVNKFFGSAPVREGLG